MLEAIINRFKRDRRGISNVIVIMLSLVLVVVIVANVVLWSYQMNQFDWERMQEKIQIDRVESRESFSSWFVLQSEYAIDIGSLVNGSYTDTQSAEDGSKETFQEELSPAPPRNRLSINGSVSINIKNYPFNTIETVEILLKYNASDNEEKWYLKAYNWTSTEYSDNNFNDTSGNQPSATDVWVYYSVNLTDHWQSYVRDDGLLCIQIHDGTSELPSENKTRISIDFLGARVKGTWTSLILLNRSPLTIHVASVWIVNSTCHRRYNADFFVNSGENTTYTRADITLPVENFLVKIVTERGNIAVLTND